MVKVGEREKERILGIGEWDGESGVVRVFC